MTNHKFLSIVHASGIERIPWDKVPKELKFQYPQPPAPKKPTPAADAEGSKPADAEDASQKKRGPVFGRAAPSLEDLTKRYRSDMEYTEQKWKSEKNRKAKAKKKAAYLKAKNTHDKAVSHYKALEKKHGDDKLALADEWRRTVRNAIGRKDRSHRRVGSQGQGKQDSLPWTD